MNTHLKQLWAAMRLPEKLQKSYKFFCRGLDIRVPEVMDFLREHHVEEGDNIQIIRKLKDALIVGVKGSRFAMGNEIADRIQV